VQDIRQHLAVDHSPSIRIISLFVAIRIINTTFLNNQV
jgi:hypothetical protein